MKTNKTLRILGIFAIVLCLVMCLGITAFAAGTEANVAEVNGTGYATIDDAIAAWTNGTTLTLLADVTLSDTVKLKSTEHHTLDLGTYTMTAASGKNAIEITCEGRSSASYAITVNADATNPGGITATGKACIYYSKSGSIKDRPIIRIHNGVFNGSYSINSKSNGNTNCPQIWIYGGTFNGNVNLTKNMLRVFGGTFNGWINCTGDSSAYREISGGRFKSWQFMTADADNKFWVGTSKANYNVGCYVDNEGYLVVGGGVITEAADKFEASSANYGGWSSYLKYSSAKDNGLYYTSVEEALADNNKTTGSVTVYVDELDMAGISYKGTIVVPADSIKITNAPANLRVTNKAGETLTPDENGIYIKAVAKIGNVGYATLAKAIEAAENGDTVVILPGEYGAIDISNKNITIQGTVGENGELLTVIKGGNPAITAHGFNGTIKDIKIVDAFKVMYAEPAGNVTVDNIYVTGATYGLHLVAYSKDITWTLQNSYMDLSWANSFGVYGEGDATIVIKDNVFESTKPYYPDYGALAVNSFLPNVTVEGNVFGKNTKIKLDADASKATVQKNYHADGVENALVEDSEKAYITSYYKNSDLTGLVNLLKGSGTATDPYQIGSLEDLIMFRDSVNAGETKYNASGVYVVLTADIDMASINWVGIGSATAEHGFMGNFNGNGYKIKNLTITNPAVDSDGYAYAGFFGVTEGAADAENVIKNLIIENVTISTTGDIVAAAIAYPYYTTVENITVCGDINITGGNYTAGALAYTRRCVNASNVTVSGNAGSAITGKATVGGVISDIQMNGGLTANYSDFAVSGVTITGEKSVGGIAGIIAAQTLNGATVKNVTIVSNDARVGIVAGSLGGASTITSVTVENVTGANAIVGADYSSGAVVGAKVGDTYYKTFADAYAAANDGETITLLAPIVVNEGETLTLDKNVTITYTSDVVGEDMITVRGTLNVAAGKITYVNNSNGSNVTVSTISAEPGSVVNVTGGTIENKSVAPSGSSSYAYAIDILTNGSLGDVTVTISGGTVYSDYVAIRQFNNGDACKNTLNVTDGYIYGAKRAIQIHMKNNAAYLTISGGEIKADGDYTLCFLTTSENLSVTGGTFSGAVWYSGTKGFISGGTFSSAVVEEYCAEGYIPTKNADDTYGVKEGSYVARVNGVGYETLADAFAAAKAGDTITILKGEYTVDINVNKSGITIVGETDANGNRLVKITGKLSITADDVTVKNLTITMDGSNVTIGTINAKNVVIDGCKIVGANAFAGCTTAGKVTFMNSEILGTKTYGIQFIGTQGGQILIDTCTISGWTTFASNLSDVTIKNSKFVKSTSNTIRLYGNIAFENTAFNTSTVIDYGTNDREATFTNCSVSDGSALTNVMYLPDVVNKNISFVINGEKVIVEAMIGNKAYLKFTDALKAAKAGDTIKLTYDITTSEIIVIDKAITIDLNGHKVTSTAKKAFEVYANATIKNGIIEAAQRCVDTRTAVELTLTDVTLIADKYTTYGNPQPLTIGGSKNGTKVTMTNVTISAEAGYGIITFVKTELTATRSTIGGYSALYVKPGSENSIFNFVDCDLSGSTMNNDAEGNSFSTIAVRADNVVVTVDENSTVTANGNYCWAISMESKFTNENGITGSIVTVAGTINGQILTSVDTKNNTVSVKEEYADELLAAYYVTKEPENGMVTVDYKAAAVIGNKYYFETLAEAVANAQNKNVIKLLCDCEGPGIVIDKNITITIDFNGHTYTLTADAVGSSNTKTNGFQILKGNTVEFKNGTIKVADEAASKYAMLIQNYANLKIRNMTLDGTNLDYSAKVSYVVSINSGRVYFIGDVVVKSNDRNLAGDVAIDVYDYSAAGYDLPMVDIPETVKIDEYATIADAAEAGKVLAAARASKVFYASIQQAIDNSASFSLVQDYVGPGFVIDKHVNINLAGFTLTINEGVGSANTKTNGIQILKGAKVGLSNGKIEAADNGKLAILIQNYGDLQITNVELDGTNLDYSSKVSYTLSINSGNVKLMGTTNVIANDRNLPGDIAIDVYDYSAAGYELPIVSIYSTVTYTEGKLYAAAKYGNYHYSSLQQCIDKHGTATLVCDFAGPGVVFNKNATINFNGYTYTFTSGVGSTGTESNGFQILKGNRVTLNNGTLKVADSAANKFYILVQNYGDLTLNSMTLDGTNLDKWSKTDGDSYTLSNNSGNVNINGTSKIVANNDGDKAFAFDVCDKSAWGYELPKVKVAATATIDGNIEAAAKIGVNYYATLAQAIADRDNASSKDKIVLMSNIVLKDTLTIEASKAIVLDLNGYTISQEKACTGHYAMIVNKAILTIEDSVGGGKISFTDTGAGDPNFGWGSYTIVNENKLYVNDGTIENLSAQNANGSVKHMYCAIQQNNAKAQLQINGGTISTPSYRSIRINAGSLTFGTWATTEEGATIEGQVWIQPFADGIKVNVNNGKFSPKGVDSSSIYVDNSSKTVAFRVNGGSFAGKIGCANAEALKGAIRAGSFTEDAKEKTNAALFHKNFVK